VQWQDVGVLQPGDRLDLAKKSFRPKRGGELGMQDFDGDGPPMAEVPGQKDRSHAAAAELALDRVAVGEGSRKAVGEVRHGFRG
jgi:hypothetical protein